MLAYCHLLIAVISCERQVIGREEYCPVLAPVQTSSEVAKGS